MALYDQLSEPSFMFLGSRSNLYRNNSDEAPDKLGLGTRPDEDLQVFEATLYKNTETQEDIS